MMAATPPAVDAPKPYAEMLTAAPTKVTAGPPGSDGLRTIGLLLGAALAVGVGFLALGGDTSVLNSLTAYAADGGVSADVVQSFSLIFLSEIGDNALLLALTLALTLTLALALTPTVTQAR